MHGNTTAACHFSKEMGMKIAKGTVRGMKTKLNQALTHFQPTRRPLGKWDSRTGLLAFHVQLTDKPNFYIFSFLQM